MRHKRILLFACILVPLFSGCSLYNKTSYIDDDGRLPPSFFDQLRRDKTTQAWVVSQLGEPESIQQGPEQKQIYNYRLSKTEHKHADLLVVMRIDGKHTEVEYLHIFFNEQRVQKNWRDQYSLAHTYRYFSSDKPMLPTAALKKAFQSAQYSEEAKDGEAQGVSAEKPKASDDSLESLQSAESTESSESMNTSTASNPVSNEVKEDNQKKSFTDYFKIWPWSKEEK